MVRDASPKRVEDARCRADGDAPHHEDRAWRLPQACVLVPRFLEGAGAPLGWKWCPLQGPSPLVTSEGHGAPQGASDQRPSCDGTRFCDRRQVARSAQTSPRSAHTLRRSIAALVDAGPRFRPGLIPGSSASSLRGSVVTPGGVPAPPECVLTRHTRRRRTLLRHLARLRRRPSMSRVMCFYSYRPADVKRLYLATSG